MSSLVLTNLHLFFLEKLVNNFNSAFSLKFVS